jgi:hypothetical protein
MIGQQNYYICRAYAKKDNDLKDKIVEEPKLAS